MSSGDVLTIFRDSIFTMLTLSAPLLVVSIGIGLIIAIFQAATQIHEQTLTFVPKIVASAFLLLMLGSWMITVLSELFQRVCSMALSL